MRCGHIQEAIHKLLVLVSVPYANIRSAVLFEDGKWEAPDIGLNLGIAEFTANQKFRVEDSVLGVHRILVLSGIAKEAFTVSEGNVGRRCAIALVVCNDVHMIVLPDSDATGEQVSV